MVIKADCWAGIQVFSIETFKNYHQYRLFVLARNKVLLVILLSIVIEVIKFYRKSQILHMKLLSLWSLKQVSEHKRSALRVYYFEYRLIYVSYLKVLYPQYFLLFWKFIDHLFIYFDKKIKLIKILAAVYMES